MESTEAVLLVSAANIRSEALSRCTRQGIRVASLSKNGRIRFVVGGPTQGNELLRMAQCRQADDVSTRDNLARSFVAGKLRNQRRGADIYAHGLVYRLQDGDPTWRALDEAFMWHRIGNEQITADNPPSLIPREAAGRLAEMYPGSGYGLEEEVARPDQFGNAYVGKRYLTGADGIPRSSEVSTMGVQAWAHDPRDSDSLFRLTTGRYKATTDDENIRSYEKSTTGGPRPFDRDFARYTLGVLATMALATGGTQGCAR